MTKVKSIITAEIEHTKRRIRYWRKEFNAIRLEKRKLRADILPKQVRLGELREKLDVGLTRSEWAEWDKLKKEVKSKEKRIIKLDKEFNNAWTKLEDLESRLEELKEQLEAKLEFIDIDDSNGYGIWFGNGEYFLAPNENMIDMDKGFKTLQIYINYTFDTEKTPSYSGRGDPQRLQAEMRIIITIRNAGKKVVDALIEMVKVAFEEYTTYVFGDNEKATRYGKFNMVPIFPSTGINKSIEEYENKKLFMEAWAEKVGIMKIGAYFRLSDDEPNIDIMERKAKLDFYGEWSHKMKPGYTGHWMRWRGGEIARNELFSDFDLEEYFMKTTKWDPVISRISGKKIKKESAWVLLTRLMEEQEK